MAFDKKRAKGLIDPRKFENKFEKEFTQTNSGWAIYWKGERVKPQEGKSDTYASHDAAIKALDRNMPNFSQEVEKIVFEGMTGKKITASWIVDDPVYIEHFRTDLWWNMVYVDGKLNHKTCRDKKTLTAEEREILDVSWKEEDAFKRFCRNAVMTIMVPEWMAMGILEIKKV